MTFEEASRKYKLPIKVLHRLRELGLITGNMLTDSDTQTADIMSRIYGDPVLLRAQISKFNKARREGLIRAPELTKWERYVINRYANHIAKKSGGRLYVKQIADEISRYYGIEKSSAVIGRIYQLRKRTYNDMRRRV
jgi:hypothetical protein